MSPHQIMSFGEETQETKCERKVRLPPTFDDEVNLIEKGAAPELVTSVKELHKRYHKAKGHDNVGYWRPLSITWGGEEYNNTFEFGEDANIVVSVCPDNTHWESTIKDALLLALFGARSTKGTSVLSEELSPGFALLRVAHNNAVYEIRRDISMNGEKCVTKFTRCPGEDLSGRWESDTHEQIERYFGGLGQFMKANMITRDSPFAISPTSKPNPLLKHFDRVCETEHYDKCLKQCETDLANASKKLACLVEETKRATEKAGSRESVEREILLAETKFSGLISQCAELEGKIDRVEHRLGWFEDVTMRTKRSVSEIDKDIELLQKKADSLPKRDNGCCYSVAYANSRIETKNATLSELGYIRPLAEIAKAKREVDSKILAMEERAPKDGREKLMAERARIEQIIRTGESLVKELKAICVVPSEELPDDFSIRAARRKESSVMSALEEIPRKSTISDYPTEEEMRYLRLGSYELRDMLALERDKLNGLSLLPRKKTSFGESRLRDRIREPLNVDPGPWVPINLDKKIGELKKERDTLSAKVNGEWWYQEYVHDDVLTVPMEIFISNYYNSDTTKQIQVSNKLSRLLDIKKARDSIESKKRDNVLIERNNDEFRRQINWVLYERCKCQVELLEKCLDERLAEESALRRVGLEAELSEVRRLIGLHDAHERRSEVKSIISENKRRESELELTNVDIGWYQKYNRLISERDALLDEQDDSDKASELVEEISDLKRSREYLELTESIDELEEEKRSVEKGEIIAWLKRADLDLKLAKSNLAECERGLVEKKRVISLMDSLDPGDISGLEFEVSVYNEYKRLFAKSYIPSELRKQILILFIEKANEVFSCHTKYSLSYEISPSEDFLIVEKLTGNNVTGQSLSGHEKLLLRVAICKATMEVSQLRGPLILDGSLSCIDQAQFDDKVANICDVVKEHFGVTILVSDMDIPDDSADQKIGVAQTDGVSRITGQ